VVVDDGVAAGDEDVGADDLAGPDDLAGGDDFSGAEEWAAGMVGAPAGDGLGATGGCEPALGGRLPGADDVAAMLVAPASLLRCVPVFAWPPPASSA
jgi:hypothetical protein